ncbi:type IV pilus modification PilV family protein [Marinobacterium marinum]|uniref:Prepilin-type N-terminal cleavage/methylation domain-containing protein n=1 Tax=Marinobacterium marinum TaxID=2756129 RepID=A0A7W1WVI8_9GAMM|nr:prepilin-type N-terminal cleavage/methylation domain-containing protein [Marinobacterium marinum]MBA4501009.1 prepilin-type N-terminal cleavage/methylation domain-containing protein [Marinobacterium marinum]
MTAPKCNTGRQQGFSLLEMLVAMVILAMSLGVLYQAAAGATRNARVASGYTEALVIGRSLFEQNRVVTVLGEQSGSAGSNGKYEWLLSADEVATDVETAPDTAKLAQLEILVKWQDGDVQRQILLNSRVPLKLEQP